MKVMQLFFSLVLTAGMLISVNAGAVGLIPVSCTWNITSSQRMDVGPSSIVTTATNYACKSAGITVATKRVISGLFSDCSINVPIGYTFTGGCQNPSIVKYKTCPIKIDGCSTTFDAGKLNLPTHYLFPGVLEFKLFFKNQCNNHDICYGTIGMSKATCDSNFKADMRGKCNSEFDFEWYDPRYPAGKAANDACKTGAEVFYRAVDSDSIALQAYNEYQATAWACD